MSSYAQLYLHGVEIFSWRNVVDPAFLFLFMKDDVYHRADEIDDEYEYSLTESCHARATAAVLRDRLEVLGIGQATLNEKFSQIKDSGILWLQGVNVQLNPWIPGRAPQHFRIATNQQINDERDTTLIELVYLNSEYRDQLPDIELAMRANRELLESITLADWANLFIEALKSPKKRESGIKIDPKSYESLIELWGEDTDPRFLLGAALLACEPDEEITLNVSDLIDGDWLDPDFDPQQVAAQRFSHSLAYGTPPVIITEGSTDAHFLQAAIRIRYPHLQSYIRFLDFAGGVEGSAAAGVRTLKSFAGAGISNRIVLLLDNDTAAREAERAFRGSRLPDHYSVMHYPDIELARNYPTLGPTGLSDMDVNGLAGSIEIYLGRDVLTGADGKLSPVEWRSLAAGVGAYQGEIKDKTGVQKRFGEKVKQATTDPSVIANQDWSGLDAIIDSLIEVLRNQCLRTT